VKTQKNLTRESVETDLNFAGFVCVNTPLKKDSVSALKTLRESNHHLVMITGDHVLTAAFVAIKTFILNKNKKVLVIDYESDNNFDVTILDYKEDTEEQLKLDSRGVIDLLSQYQSIAITGPALEYFEKKTNQINKIVKFTSVFARTSPQQKEMIINILKIEGFTTLMCGDGTNDVGALKHAHVGIALLTGTDKKATKKEVKKVVHAPIPEGASAMERAQIQRQQKLDEMMAKMQTDMDEIPIVKLGDASIASPFTSKLANVQSVCHIIRQGRCTLVTTLMMFKILALNAIVLAYSNSV